MPPTRRVSRTAGAQKIGKTMASQSTFGLQETSAGFDRQGASDGIAQYQRMLLDRIHEEKRLRLALSLAEALLSELRTCTTGQSRQSAERAEAATCAATLTPRQSEILKLVLAGRASKNIAADLNISTRTVENHRAAIMKKTGSKSLPALGAFGFVLQGTGSDTAQTR